MLVCVSLDGRGIPVTAYADRGIPVDVVADTSRGIPVTVVANGLPVQVVSGSLGGGSGGDITAPTIQQTSANTANPLTWRVLENATFQPGYYWHVQRATSSGNLTAGTLNGEAIQQIQLEDLNGGSIVFADLTTTPAGPLALRLRVGHDDGSGIPANFVWGPWSNVLTDTIAAAPTSFSTSNKSSMGALSNSNLTWTYTGSGGSAVGISGNSTKSAGKWELKFTMNFNGATGYSPPIDFGFCLANVDFTSGFPEPGRFTSNGVEFKTYPIEINVYQATAYVDAYSATMDGADIRLLIDFTAKRAWIKINGVVASGNPTAGTGGVDLSSWLTGNVTFWAGPEANRVITVDPSPSGVTSGFTAWG